MEKVNHSIDFLAGRYISQLLAEKLSCDLVFHNFHHTCNVVCGVKEICRHLKISKDEQEILLLAAWFHDSGHIVKYIGHEEISQQIATDWLNRKRYPWDKRDEVLRCISATRLPQQPKNHLQEIICDADLYHLSLSEYCHLQFQLREEIKRVLGRKYSNLQWMKENLDFLNHHQYFTSYGKETLAKAKEENKAKCELLFSEYQLVAGC